MALQRGIQDFQFRFGKRSEVRFALQPDFVSETWRNDTFPAGGISFSDKIHHLANGWPLAHGIIMAAHNRNPPGADGFPVCEIHQFRQPKIIHRTARPFDQTGKRLGCFLALDWKVHVQNLPFIFSPRNPFPLQ